jgi:hypothetical protein
MKTLSVLGITAFIVLLFPACEEGQRDHEHDRRGRGASTSTTTTEETTVHQAAPSSTTTVRTY